MPTFSRIWAIQPLSYPPLFLLFATLRLTHWMPNAFRPLCYHRLVLMLEHCHCLYLCTHLSCHWAHLLGLVIIQFGNNSCRYKHQVAGPVLQKNQKDHATGKEGRKETHCDLHSHNLCVQWDLLGQLVCILKPSPGQPVFIPIPTEDNCVTGIP